MGVAAVLIVPLFCVVVLCLIAADDTERLCQMLDLQQLQQLVEAAGADRLNAAARTTLLQVYWLDLHLRFPTSSLSVATDHHVPSFSPKDTCEPVCTTRTSSFLGGGQPVAHKTVCNTLLSCAEVL